MSNERKTRVVPDMDLLYHIHYVYHASDWLNIPIIPHLIYNVVIYIWHFRFLSYSMVCDYYYSMKVPMIHQTRMRGWCYKSHTILYLRYSCYPSLIDRAPPVRAGVSECKQHLCQNLFAIKQGIWLICWKMLWIIPAL